jgi:hypothetical protein
VGLLRPGNSALPQFADSQSLNLRPIRTFQTVSERRFSEIQGLRAKRGPRPCYAPAFVFSATCRGYLSSEAHLWNISPAFSIEVTGWASTLQVS